MKFEWDFHELFDFRDALMDTAMFNEYCEKITKEIVAVLHKALINNTPVDFGTLQAFWQTDENYAYLVERKNGGFEVTLINKAKYATWVNDGHKQRPGRFIPGYWVGNHFRYDPNADGGMQLKKSWVDGRFFVENSILQVENSSQLDKIIYKELNKWFVRCVNGK